MAPRKSLKSTGIRINNRLRVVISGLSHKLGRTVTIQEIADATGAAPNTISGYVNNKQSARVSLRVLALLIEFFDQHGVRIDMNDLFEVKRNNENAN